MKLLISMFIEVKMVITNVRKISTSIILVNVMYEF